MSWKQLSDQIGAFTHNSTRAEKQRAHNIFNVLAVASAADQDGEITLTQIRSSRSTTARIFAASTGFPTSGAQQALIIDAGMGGGELMQGGHAIFVFKNGRDEPIERCTRIGSDVLPPRQFALIVLGRMVLDDPRLLTCSLRRRSDRRNVGTLNGTRCSSDR